MKKALATWLTAPLWLLPPRFLSPLLVRIAEVAAARTSPREAAKFLMDLDYRLYQLHGPAAVRYGNGLHTKHRHMKYHDFFSSRIQRNELVLDIGCGVGALAFSIAEKSGADVTGIDLSRSNIDQALTRFGHPRVNFQCGDALTSLPAGRYDVVVLSNVLEHLPHRSDFLRKAIQTTGSSRFLIRVPVYERDWRVPLKDELGVDYRLDPTHETEFTLETFAEETSAAGLEIQHLEVRWGEIWSELRPS
ncbi:class I SAM-dependent methyltransferase [Stratiformator vulcanicus]|uniref:Demethylrebeccamycin-D-glucose O-methyltransferase n=1 Tax=Stratiformator vulcanicus TaxID=2527980 RepID=A0A517QW25_9PLAN|nr:class I SAM-dependent methyltransferase [Stratiformator vulcanicus]QDT35770.1 Demethylrebeccamycin-D-glucose O-methyltransferase [Stratiformator vulcanicus]